MEPGRCSTHGLILAGDGKCVICRRGAADLDLEEAPRPAVSDTMWVVLIGGVVLIGAALALVLTDPFGKKAPKTQAEDAAAMPPALPTTAAPLLEAPAPPHTTVFVSMDHPKPTATAIATDDAPEPANNAAFDAAVRSEKIVFYSSATEPFCAQVRTFLQKHHYTFTEYDIDKSETDRIEMTALNPAGTVPTLTVDGNVLVGFDRSEFEATVRRVAEAKMPKR